MANPFQVSGTVLGIGLEALRGTTAADKVWFPVKGPTVEAMIQWLDDVGLRGSPGEIYDSVPGVRSDDFTLKGDVFTDTFPVLLVSLLGPDAVTGSFAHTIGLLNDVSTGSQPLSATLDLFDGANDFTSAGCQAVNMDLTWGADKALEWAVKFTGKPWTTGDSQPAADFSTVPLTPGWTLVTTIAGSPVYFTETVDLKIERKSAPIFTGAIQGPRYVFAGPISVTGTFSCVVETQSDPFTVGPGVSASLIADTNATVPLTVVTGTNDTFVFTPGGGLGSPETFTIAPGTYSSIGTLAEGMAVAIGSLSAEQFVTKVTVEVMGSKLALINVVDAGSAGNGDTISFGANDVANSLGFTENPNIFAGGSDDELALLRNQTPVTLTFTNPDDASTIELQMSQVQFFNPKRKGDKDYVTVDVEFKAEMNTTDAVDSGYSPILTITTNSVSAAYAGS